MVTSHPATSPDPLYTAELLVGAGVSVIPIILGGDKKPAERWKVFQTELPTRKQLHSWFGGSRRLAIAAVGGSVSGFLEVIDLDDRIIAKRWRDLVEAEMPGLLSRLLIVRSPRPGYHFWYRCLEGIERNQKLAQRQVGEREDGSPVVKALAETRGEGGYVLTPGCPPEAHETGRLYELVQGEFEHIPEITAIEREVLLRCARALNEWVEPEKRTQTQSMDRGADGTRPGDLYNSKTSFIELLQRHGWEVVQSDGQSQLLRRPGKDRGVSATLGRVAPGILYVFSTNAHPLQAERSYDAFGAYAYLEHRGDFTAAARALAAAGYTDNESRGRKRKVIDPVDGEEKTEAKEAQERKDYDLACRFSADRVGRLMYVTGNQWWVYDPSGIWRHRGQEHAEQILQEWMVAHTELDPRLTITRARITNVLFVAKSQLGVHDMSVFDQRTDWVPLKNGVLDLTTNRLLDHSPDNRLTRISPCDYDPTSQASRFERFLREVLLDAEGRPCQIWIDLIQEWFGYCLIPSAVVAQASMFWVGSGANGKGVLERALSAMLGEENVTGIDMEHLHDPYHRAGLYGKLLGVVNEIDRRAMLKNGQLFKAIVSGDMIKARNPMERVFDFRSFTRIIVACNALPNTEDLSHGYFRRIILIEFRRQFEEAERDFTLDAALKSELSGILNWALEGLRRLRERDYRFVIPEESLALLREYREAEDSFEGFWSERCELNRSRSTGAAKLYGAYAAWCEGNGYRPLTPQAFGRRLKGKGGARGFFGGSVNRMRCWNHIGLLGESDS